MTPHRVFRTVKSDQDVFRPAGQPQSTNERALQPRPINVSQQSRTTSQVPQASVEPVHPWAVWQHSQQPKQHDTCPTYQPQQNSVPTDSAKSRALRPAQTTAAASSSTSAAQPSPVKRSARIEAMQHTGKKLGVRAPSLLSRSGSPRNKPGTTTRIVGPANAARTRTSPLPLGLSQARQPGLPRSCSQYAPAAAASQSIAAAHHAVNPAAPFRPPGVAAGVAASVANTVRATPAAKRTTAPASSDDSFGDVDDDAAFLALACQLEY